MDIIDYLITHISPLPWSVKGPGFVIMVFLLFKAFTQIFTLRWIKSATNVVYVVIIALGMARFGGDIANYLKTKSDTHKEQTIEQDIQPSQN